MRHIKHVKYILPADKYIKQLPDYLMFRRKMMLRINPDLVPNLHWKLPNTYHTTSIGHVETQNSTVFVLYINAETLSYARGDKCGEWCRTTLNTDMSTSQSKWELTVCSIVPIT